MPRVARQVAPASWYHVIVRGNNRQTVFREECDFRYYLELLNSQRERHKIQLAHYCLMPNHVHLLLFAGTCVVLAKALQGISLSFSWWARRRWGVSGHLWQGRFKSFLIQKDSYLLECSRYIERNPVNAGMVSDPAQYPWSSYRFYAEGKANPLVTPDPGYLSLGMTGPERQHSYQTYVTATRPYEFPDPERLHPVFQGW